VDIFDTTPAITNDAPSLFPLGVTTVTFTATDAAGNDVMATSTVTVIDTTAPQVSPPADVTLEGDTIGGAELTGPGIANFLLSAGSGDIVDVIPIITNDAPAVFPLGETVVTFTAADDEGNTASATATVTIVDTTPPVLTVPANLELEGDTSGGADPMSAALAGLLTNASAADIVDPAPTITHDAPTLFPLGQTRVNFTAVDSEGNETTSSTIVSVIDMSPPVFTTPMDITVEGDTIGGANIAGSAIADLISSTTAVDVVDATLTFSDDAPDVFPLGDTLVTFTARDDSGNNATVSATVTVTDTTAPVLTVPSDLSIEADSTGGAAVTGQELSAFLAGATAMDVVDDVPTITSDAPAFFNVGDTLVTFTATDASGNQVSGSATVTVEDTTLPAISVPADTIVQGDVTGGADPAGNAITALLSSVTATDLADSGPVISSDAPALFPLGDTLVTFSATDNSGNVAMETTTVTVVDTIAPTIVAPANTTIEADIAGGADATGAAVLAFLTAATASDIVDASPVITHDAPAVLSLGNTVITFTATDASGNETMASATVSVTDTTGPSISAPASITLDANTAGGADVDGTSVGDFLQGVTATDFIDGSRPVTNDAPTFFPLGDTVVTFTSTDSSGVVSTVTTTVTIADSTGPQITVPSDITVTANVAEGAEASLSEIVSFLAGTTAVDAVDPNPVIGNDAPAIFPVGDTTVTFTATDASGNQSTETAVVSVAEAGFEPTVFISPTGPNGAADPADLPTGAQPTSWSAQRTSVREIMLTFTSPISTPDVSGITLINLGLNADVDADIEIALRQDQLVLSSDGLTLRIALDADQLSDGVYELQIDSSITGAAPFIHTGNDENDFFVLRGDWNGSGGVNIQDFATFGYWFGNATPRAPEYVDLNDSGGVNIQDFALYANNFGSAQRTSAMRSSSQVPSNR
jgi:hypothetical protein